MKNTLLRAALLGAFPLLLKGCYVVPIGSDQLSRLTQLLEQGQLPAQSAPGGGGAQSARPQEGLKTVPSSNAAPAMASMPVTLQARLYPTNDVATEVGMVSGTVTNMMNGKGRVQLTYRGEMMTGEATRVVGEERKGMANAWGANGAFMSCEYQMSAPVRGAGTCIFSDGARYQVHVGN